jgi:hypothetical protein
MYKLHDFECDRCGHQWEALVGPDEEAVCPALAPDFGVAACLGHGTPLPFTCGTGTRAQREPARIREMFGKSRAMQLKIQGRVPWRKNSYSQTSND